MKNKAFSKSPNEANQAEIQKWWETNPMTYDWEGVRLTQEGTKEWFKQVDEEFWDVSKSYAHPKYPECAPFSSLVDFNKIKGKKVLEIGCGTGAHAAVFANAGADVTAIDLTEKAVALTKKRFALFGIQNASVLNIDAENLPFPDNSFDFVWSWGVIHHSENTDKIVKEIHRVLKPNGQVSVMIYHRNSTRYYVYGFYVGIFKGKFLRNHSLYAVNMTYTDGHIARHYTRKGAVKLFADFRKVTTSVMDGPVPAMMLGWDRMSSLFPSLFKPLNSMLARRWGWFLFINATK